MTTATGDKIKKARPAISRWRKWSRFLLYTCCALLVLVLAAIYALTLPSVQRRLTNEAETYLQKKLGTRVEVGAIRLRFPYYISLEDFLMEDQQGDTLARVGSLILSIRMWELLDRTIRMEKITLEDASIFLHQKDSTYNFDFIVAAFAKPVVSSPVDTTASPWKLELDLTVLQLTKVDFMLQDDDSKMTTRAKIGSADTKIIKADLKALQFDLGDLQLADSDIRVIQKEMPSDGCSPNMIFFGFTFCPDVCPTTLSDISGWLEDLGPEVDRLNVTLISVDPERDTPAVLSDYLANFDPRITGLTGPLAEVERAAAGFRAWFE